VAEITTERLIMRGWREADLDPWAAMNADPEVRRYVGPLLTFEQAAAWALNYQDDLDRYGFGFWAVEIRTSGEFIGFTGLDDPDVDEGPLRRHVVYRKLRDPEH
jgi:RimJ/RimL family protein N-acetyltransferase